MSDEFTPQTDPDQPVVYQIRIKGHLSSLWADWFEGIAVTLEADGDTLLTGPVEDQAALHGLLKKIRDLGMELISVNRNQFNERHHFLVLVLNNVGTCCEGSCMELRSPCCSSGVELQRRRCQFFHHARDIYRKDVCFQPIEHHHNPKRRKQDFRVYLFRRAMCDSFVLFAYTMPFVELVA